LDLIIHRDLENLENGYPLKECKRKMKALLCDTQLFKYDRATTRIAFLKSKNHGLIPYSKIAQYFKN